MSEMEERIEQLEKNQEMFIGMIMLNRACIKTLMEFTCVYGAQLGADRMGICEKLNRRVEENRGPELEMAEQIDPALAARLDTRPIPGVFPDDEWSPAS